MKHLTLDQIESYLDGEAPQLDAHVAVCARCQKQSATARRVNRALSLLERVAPAPAFAARLERALPAARAASNRARGQATYRAWTGVAAFLSAFLLIVFAYQTFVALQIDGALDFVSLFASRPDLLSLYPSESLSALVEATPLLEMVLTLVVLVVAAVLTQQFVGGRGGAPTLARNGD